MNVVNSLWTSIQGDPKFMRRVNGWLTIFWLVMMPVAFFMGWLQSVMFVSALSLWALVSGHWSAWQAARVEVNQVKQDKKKDKEDIPGDVAKEVVKREKQNKKSK